MMQRDTVSDGSDGAGTAGGDDHFTLQPVMVLEHCIEFEDVILIESMQQVIPHSELTPPERRFAPNPIITRIVDNLFIVIALLKFAGLIIYNQYLIGYICPVSRVSSRCLCKTRLIKNSSPDRKSVV